MDVCQYNAYTLPNYIPYNDLHFPRFHPAHIWGCIFILARALLPEATPIR